jgi:hypothetical protein
LNEKKKALEGRLRYKVSRESKLCVKYYRSS